MAITQNRRWGLLTRGLLVAAVVAAASAGLSLARPQRAEAGAVPVGPTLWTTVASPQVANSFLSGITCVNADDCWAVGFVGSILDSTALVEQYNGTSWSVVGSPAVSGGAYLAQVSCVGVDDCWAVGLSGGALDPSALIEQYHGTSWSVVSTAPAPGRAPYSEFAAVTCLSADDCWAVGNYADSNDTTYTLTEQYTGSAWDLVSSLSVVGSPYSVLNGVACASASECWAVGYSTDNSGNSTSLTEEYTGSSWSIATNPGPAGSAQSGLFGVTCVSTSDCWAVGQYADSSGYWFTLTQQYGGSSWSTVASPNPPSSVNGVHFGVTCASASDCWAVGYYLDSSNEQFTLIEQYNGTSWSLAYSPSPSDNAELVQPACISAADCIAVGVDWNSGQALIEQTYQPVATAYTALSPSRICDTRTAAVTGYSTECSSDGPLGQGATMTFQVTGVGSEPVPSDAQSVVLNVTAISGTAGTFLTAFPAGSAVPTASNINVNAATNQANLVVVALGAGGQVSIYNSLGSINVAVDVEGYFAAPSGSSSVPGLFHPISPLRICDSRSGTGTACSGSPLGPGQWTRVVVSGCPTGDPTCTPSVPATDAAAVALNLTAVSGTSLTYMAVEPAGAGGTCPSGTPQFSNVNVNAQTNLPNRVIVPLGPANDVCVYNSLGSINFILDVNGWFGNGSESTQGAEFYAVSPLRICDTRDELAVNYSTECSDATLTQGGTLTIPVAGVDSLPADGGATPPVAVIANVTAVSGSAFTYFTLYPANVSLPNASDLNVSPQQNTPNLVIVQLPATGGNAGEVDLYNNQGSIDAIVDVAGWFQLPPVV